MRSDRTKAGMRAALELGRWTFLAPIGPSRNGTTLLAAVYMLEPDVIVTEIAMPGMDGLEATAEILDWSPTARVVMVTSYDGMDVQRQALAAGALGFVTKLSADDELLPAVHAACRGERFVGRRARTRIRYNDGPRGRQWRHPIGRSAASTTKVAQVATSCARASLGGLTVRPSKGSCTFAMAFAVDRGAYGTVSLDGRAFIVLGLTPEEMAKGNWSVGLIADERASAEQRDAITAIASGAAGGPMAALAGLIGTFLGVKSAPIHFDRSGAKWSITASDLETWLPRAPRVSTPIPLNRCISTTPATRPLIALRSPAFPGAASALSVWHGKTSAARTMASMRRFLGAMPSLGAWVPHVPSVPWCECLAARCLRAQSARCQGARMHPVRAVVSAPDSIGPATAPRHARHLVHITHPHVGTKAP